MSILDQIEDFQETLADWYANAQRPLPWRIQPSLYRTVVSELMAQQTQIKTMLPFFERWMQRFPDFNVLANAPVEDVLKHWEGLGYYNRARNLHRLAKAYVGMKSKPRTAKEWQLLPGIGPYTSAAISSITEDYPAAVVDGNVVRILTRLTNDNASYKSNADAVKAVSPLADQILDRCNSGTHNQAMMELGATICTKGNPRCTACPATKFCASFVAGTQSEIPKIQRKATIKVETTRFWVIHDDHLLLHQNSDNAKQLAGQYELPNADQLKQKKPRTKPLIVKKRGITQHRITESIHPLNRSLPLEQIVQTSVALKWVPLKKLQSITISGPHRRWISELLTQSKQSS